MGKGELLMRMKLLLLVGVVACLFFGSKEEPRAVSLAAQRLRHPEERELEPASPEVSKLTTQDCVALVPEESLRKMASGL